MCEASTCGARVQAPQGTPPGVARVCRTVKLRRNSTGHVSRCRLRKRPLKRSQSVRVCRAGVSRRQAKGEGVVSAPQGTRPGSTARGCHAVKLRGNSQGTRRGYTGHSTCRARVQAPQGTPPGVARAGVWHRRAKGELHRARVQVCRAVKLRGNPTGHASRLYSIQGTPPSVARL